MTEQEKTAWIIQRRIPDSEAEQIFNLIQTAEKSGLFDGMFGGGCEPAREYPSREKLMQKLEPGTSFPIRETFLNVYGYEISTPGYAEQVISHLEKLGCSNARRVYETVIHEYQSSRDQAIKTAVSGLFDKPPEGDGAWKETEIVKLLQQKRQLLIEKSRILTDR
ncbi:MAG: hypothetical protein LUG98_13120 [Tannerellaceae bacterium]|nr:hypothetical protein [Tannerellaceae bacterium]